ncbi:hypothetical protein BDN72DRAFT_962370 [Pluteus cervinus]|uniref:Uncharacterized protein n=1 Tax=Pluteus cervinus TaxID=181527 RepID=A0ACD3AJJ5_9AGAR|nr:hypothetical protein BDN72DRAFT_962370 [Pluteus cervinus]
MSLARSMGLIYDLSILRHATYATSVGDIGSVWECLKDRLMPMAGSGCSTFGHRTTG